jgi:hypothetical protein
LLPDLPVRKIAAIQSLDDSLDVAIHNRDRFIEHDAGHGGCCITSNAGQSSQGFGRAWEPAAVVPHEFLRALAHHARSPVVAQSTPGGKDRIFRRRIERFHVGEAFQKNAVMFQHSGDSRLLEHDFGKPDGVGIASPAPGKVTAVAVVPAEESSAKSGQILTGR